jgi:hypothetical protein
MSYFKNDNVQVAEYEYDFAVDGGATGVKVLSSKANKAGLPASAIVVGHQVLIQTAFAGSGASCKIGCEGDDDKYLVNTAVGGLTAGLKTSSATAFFADAANEDDVRITIASAALTAGKLKVLVHFVNPNA